MDIRFKEPQRHRAILVDAHSDRERFLECLLMDRGIFVVGRFGSIGELNGAASVPVSDLVILIDNGLSERFCQALAALTARLKLPVVAISETDDPLRIEAAVMAGANAVLSIGASSDRLRTAVVSAIAGFEKLSSVVARAESAERKLEERKLVERAKGILMHQRAIGEADAFRELQRTSMARNEPLATVARSIIAAKELLG